jgi:microcystin-dependent protein
VTPFTGQIIAVAFKTAPSGWVACDGQFLPISGYEALFAILGTRYGGNGQSNFGVPNLNGRVFIGQGQAPGLPAYVAGDTGGSETVTLLSRQVGAHSHVLQASNKAGDVNAPNNTTILAQNSQTNINMYAVDSPAAPAPADTPLSPSSITPTKGGFQPHENRQPFCVVNYIMCVDGIFPPRG